MFGLFSSVHSFSRLRHELLDTEKSVTKLIETFFDISIALIDSVIETERHPSSQSHAIPALSHTP